MATLGYLWGTLLLECLAFLTFCSEVEIGRVWQGKPGIEIQVLRSGKDSGNLWTRSGYHYFASKYLSTQMEK